MSDVVITSQAPQQAADIITFAAGPVEHIDLDTYAFTGFNTEGLELAIDVMLGNLQLAREHKREDVRAWMKRYVEDILSWSNIYKFHIDFDTLVMIAAKDRETEFHSTPEIAQAAMDALTWSYTAGMSVSITRHAIAALRAAVLNVVPEAVSFHLDYSGDEDGGMWVDWASVPSSVQPLASAEVLDNVAIDDLDEDGEIQRAASDVQKIEALLFESDIISRVNRSDYNVLIIDPVELGQSTQS